MEFEHFDEYLGNSFYEKRVLKRMTQEELANKISERLISKGAIKGITRQAYALYEKGSRSMPYDVFLIACDILELDFVKVFNNACDALKK